ncbi:MAG: hypothetical protein ACRC2T_02630 [Thermoguttaceae bacterium]
MIHFKSNTTLKYLISSLLTVSLLLPWLSLILGRILRSTNLGWPMVIIAIILSLAAVLVGWNNWQAKAGKIGVYGGFGSLTLVALMLGMFT